MSELSEMFSRHGMSIKRNLVNRSISEIGETFNRVGRIVDRLKNHLVGPMGVGLIEDLERELPKLLNADGADNHEYVFYRVEWHYIVAMIDKDGNEVGILSKHVHSTQWEAEQAFDINTKPHPTIEGRQVAIGRMYPAEFNRPYIKRVEVRVGDIG